MSRVFMAALCAWASQTEIVFTTELLVSFPKSVPPTPSPSPMMAVSPFSQTSNLGGGCLCLSYSTSSLSGSIASIFRVYPGFSCTPPPVTLWSQPLSFLPGLLQQPPTRLSLWPLSVCLWCSNQKDPFSVCVKLQDFSVQNLQMDLHSTQKKTKVLMMMCKALCDQSAILLSVLILNITPSHLVCPRVWPHCSVNMLLPDLLLSCFYTSHSLHPLHEYSQPTNPGSSLLWAFPDHCI